MILDPCFMDPNLVAEFVVCPTDFETLSVIAVVYRDLTRTDDSVEPPPAFGENILAMKLADGTVCTAYSGGTATFAGGEYVTHFCRDDATGIVGGIDQSEALWMVRVVPLEGPINVETELVAVLEAWS